MKITFIALLFAGMTSQAAEKNLKHCQASADSNRGMSQSKTIVIEETQKPSSKK